MHKTKYTNQSQRKEKCNSWTIYNRTKVTDIKHGWSWVATGLNLCANI